MRGASHSRGTTTRKNTHPIAGWYARLTDALTGALFRLLGQRLWDKLYISLSSSKCFYGHIRTQLAKDRVSVSLGPALERQSESYRPNRRTGARRQGIENLRAIHPWVDLISHEMFLMGFNAGEQSWFRKVRQGFKWRLCSPAA